MAIVKKEALCKASNDIPSICWLRNEQPSFIRGGWCDLIPGAGHRILASWGRYFKLYYSNDNNGNNKNNNKHDNNTNTNTSIHI